jgi:hypothetical protein
MFDALTSFAFNLGCGALQESTLRRRLNGGSYGSVCGELRKWVKAGGRTLAGLVRRRNAECNLFNSCKGLSTAGAYIACDQADPCTACLLNSQNDAVLGLYEDSGWNTTCSYSNWEDMKNDWCNTTAPWECYYKTPSGAGNNTDNICSMCASRPPPNFPDYEDESNVTCTTYSGADLCVDSDCDVTFENSTCNPMTGNCLRSGVNENDIPVKWCNKEGEAQFDDASSTLSMSFAVLVLAYLAL